MRKIVFVMILLILVLGCDNKMKDSDKSSSNHFNIFTVLTANYDIGVDNEISLSSLDQNYYSLSELEDYFSDFSISKRDDLMDDTYKLDEITEINEVFPIKVLRLNNETLYTIYPVKEGGLYYVFFTIAYPIDYNYENLDKVEIVCFHSVYIDNLKNEVDFMELEKGYSSFEDVRKISDVVELKINLSSGIFSYTLLNDSKLLEVKYILDDESKSLVVEKIGIVADGPTDLKNIYKNDLPMAEKS